MRGEAMNITIGGVIRWRRTKVGRRLTVRIHRLRLEWRISWNPPWGVYYSTFFLRIKRIQGGYRCVLRLYRMYGDWQVQWISWGATPNERWARDQRRMKAGEAMPPSPIGSRDVYAELDELTMKA